MPMIASPQQRAAAQPEPVIVGWVGQVLKKASVYADAKLGSRVHFTVDPGPEAFLVVEPSAPEGWVKILLTNGSYGFMQSGAIELVQDTEGRFQQVTAQVTRPSQPRVATNTTGSRSGAARATAAELGTTFKGTPYKWGGNDINNGIDCSAFVQQLYGAIGLQLPRTAAQQALVGTPITRLEDLRKGDRLYFWENRRNTIGHTGLYLGDGTFVHSSSSRRGVAIDRLTDPKWKNILVAARR
jgi:cell wall-associated NlpC family hydrolase